MYHHRLFFSVLLAGLSLLLSLPAWGQVIYKDSTTEVSIIDGELCVGAIGSNETCFSADGSITQAGTASSDLGATDADSMSVTPSATPGYCPGDTDAPGSDKRVGCIRWNYKDGADGSENADFSISAIQGGVEEPEQIVYDESDDALELTPTVHAPRCVVLITAATYTIGSAGSHDAYGCTFINNDNDALTITAPAGVTGMHFKVMNGAGVTGAITIEPDASDLWVLAGVAGDAGDYIDSAGAAGDLAEVFFSGSTQWQVEYKVGTWAHEP
jgi:hypothetical protein